LVSIVSRYSVTLLCSIVSPTPLHVPRSPGTAVCHCRRTREGGSGYPIASAALLGAGQGQGSMWSTRRLNDMDPCPGLLRLCCRRGGLPARNWRPTPSCQPSTDDEPYTVRS
jgi:hypothetical protein